MVFGLNRQDMWHEWLLARCKEIQDKPDFHLDLWFRGAGKSSIITLGKTIQDILDSHGDEPNSLWEHPPTFGIFACTRPLAKQFLAQIKREFEQNVLLRDMFPDIIWDRPHTESPSWSIDGGLVLKRNNNPKEATVEAWGVVEGQPTSKHFDVLIFDDMVTIENVRSTAMIQKTTQSWELALNLGSKNSKIRYIGTRYHYADTYKVMLDRKAAIPRVHPATDNGLMDGKSVFLSEEQLAQKRREQGPYAFSSQMLLNPVADNAQGFKRDWLRYYTYNNHDGMNVYITVDPANEKKETSDYTVMIVIGLAEDNNMYLLDMVRDRLSLTERANCLFNLHRRYRPLSVGYEKYGMQADLDYINMLMSQRNYHFHVVPLGGIIAKVDRIRRLIPYFEQGRVFIPDVLHKTDYQGRTQNLAEIFVEQEFLNFPVAEHDDMLDALARVLDADLDICWPMIQGESKPVDRWARAFNESSAATGWSA